MAETPGFREGASATGNLASNPLAHLLVYARNKRLTGALELREDGGREGAIAFVSGAIAGAKVVPNVAYFGTVAYELGLIDGPTLDATLLLLASKKALHGELLIERGAITPDQRDSILREQTARKVHSLFSFPRAAMFAFYEAAPGTPPPVALDPLVPIWRGIREHPPRESVKEVLDKYAASAFKLTNERAIQRAELTPEEADVARTLLTQPASLAQLRAMTTLPAHVVDLLVYMLLITKHVDPVPIETAPLARTSAPAIRVDTGQPFVPPQLPPQISVQAAAPPPKRASMSFSIPTPIAGRAGVPTKPSFSFQIPTRPPPIAKSSSRPPASGPRLLKPAELGAAGIAQRAQNLENEDYFTALGLPEGASVEEARFAFFHLAKAWHPDRIEAAGLAVNREDAMRIFAHMTRAHTTLTDAPAREKYIAERTPRKRDRTDLLHEVEHALKRRDFRAAATAAQGMIDLDADDTEGRALLVWANVSATECSEELLRQELPNLDRAVQADRYCERALYYRAMINKRLNNMPAAMRDFSRVAQMNPKHVDAAREVRLGQMRSKKSGEHRFTSAFPGSKSSSSKKP